MSRDTGAVVAELIQSLGEESLDYIAGSWDLVLEPFNATYVLYTLRGDVVGQIKYTTGRPEIRCGSGEIKPEEVIQTKTNAEAELVLYDYVKRAGLILLSGLPTLGPWVRINNSTFRRHLGSHEHRYFEAKLGRQRLGVEMSMHGLMLGKKLPYIPIRLSFIRSLDLLELADDWLLTRHVKLSPEVRDEHLLRSAPGGELQEVQDDRPLHVRPDR